MSGENLSQGEPVKSGVVIKRRDLPKYAALLTIATLAACSAEPPQPAKPTASAAPSPSSTTLAEPTAAPTRPPATPTNAPTRTVKATVTPVSTQEITIDSAHIGHTIDGLTQAVNITKDVRLEGQAHLLRLLDSEAVPILIASPYQHAHYALESEIVNDKGEVDEAVVKRVIQPFADRNIRIIMMINGYPDFNNRSRYQNEEGYKLSAKVAAQIVRMFPRVIIGAQIGSEYPWDGDSPVVNSQDEYGKLDVVIPRHIAWASHHAQALREVSPEIIIMGPGQGSFDLDPEGEIQAAREKQSDIYDLINWSDYAGEEGLEHLVKTVDDIPEALRRKLSSIAKRYGENIRRILTDPGLRGANGKMFGAGVAAFAEDQINATSILGDQLGGIFNREVYGGQFAAAFATGSVIEALHARESVPSTDERRVIMARFPLIDLEYGPGTSLLGMADYHTGKPRPVYRAYQLMGQSIRGRVIGSSGNRVPINYLVTEDTSGTNILIVNQSLESRQASITLPGLKSREIQVRRLRKSDTEITEIALLQQGTINYIMEPLEIASVIIK